MAKKKFEPGDVFALPLKSGKYAFGLACVGNEFAFFAQPYDSTNLPTGLLESKVAFRVPVAKDAPKAGKWVHVGKLELKGEFAKPGRYLHKPIGSDQCFIYSAGQEVPSHEAECRGLEVLATWFSFHIEERLEDFFAGRENAYVQAIRRQLGI